MKIPSKEPIKIATTFITVPGRPYAGYKVGEYVDAVVIDVAGADLVAQPL